MKLKKVSCILLSCALIMPTLKVDAKQVVTGGEPYVNVVTTGNTITRTMDLTSLNLYTSDDTDSYNDNVSTSVYDIATSENILRQVGYTDVELNAMGDEEIIDSLESAKNITTTEVYIKVDELGNSIEVTKEECMKAVEDQYTDSYNSDTMVSAFSNDAENEQTDGYMRIRTVSTYISNGKYRFSGLFTWLTMPTNRWVDVFSVAAPNCAWGSNTNDLTSNLSYSIYNTKTGTTTDSKVTGSVKVKSTGIYSKYDLPDNELIHPSYGGDSPGMKSVTSMVGYIRGVATVSTYQTSQIFNVFTQYVHLHKNFGLNPEASFSWDGVGFSVSPSITEDTRIYNSFNETSYTP